MCQFCIPPTGRQWGFFYLAAAVCKTCRENGHWAVGFNVRVCGTGKMHWKSDSAGAAESGGSPTAVRSYGCSAVQTGRLSEQSNLRLLQTVNVLKTNIHSNETKVIDHFQFSRKADDDDAAFPNRPGNGRHLSRDFQRSIGSGDDFRAPMTSRIACSAPVVDEGSIASPTRWGAAAHCPPLTSLLGELLSAESK